MMFGVMLGSLMRRMRGVQAMGMRQMRVMAALVMIAVVVMLGGLAMMMRRLGVMFGGGFVVMAVGLAAHGALLVSGC